MARCDPFEFFLPDEAATALFARRLGARLGAGDTILLEGQIGAGKSFFARALIQSRMAAVGPVEDVPSPTFTLVQTYVVGNLEIWHADLYRLGDIGEVAELGLDDAFEGALCLIEWPDRLGDNAPAHALTLNLEPVDDNDQRRVSAVFSDPNWAHLLNDLPGVAHG